MKRAQEIVGNRLLRALAPRDRLLLTKNLEAVTLEDGAVLFEPGEDVISVYFPGLGTVTSLILNLRDGATAEAALIGQEGAVGGIISGGDKPAFTRGVVQIGGPAMRLATNALEKAKLQSPTLRDHFARYADCLLAQALQSVACNAIHDLDARLARWLLSVQDRIGSNDLHLTQEFIAEMVGVQRPYVTRVIGILEKTGAIRKSRGTLTVVNRGKLERQACECYAYLRRHFERALPGVYPKVTN
jgi:CRP-like cAMP-binding protein